MAAQWVFWAACAAALSITSAAAEGDDYPFAAFLGTWTLEDDRFQQVWDGQTVETLSIPGHMTNCQPLNTQGSVLCLVDAVDFQGHILWTVAADGKTVRHQSHFGTSRMGDGEGTLDQAGNLTLKIRFHDEPEGTYRVYHYQWDGADRYEMMSRQYTTDGQPTGNWYGGAFVRFENENASQ